MGQIDQTIPITIRDELCRALAEVEDATPNCVRAQTLRLVLCAITDRDVIARSKGTCSGCEETEIRKLLETMVAQREVSAREYDEAGRIADAERERDEIEVIEVFLPKSLSGAALETAVASVVAELDAKKLKDVGRCMLALRERFPGQIEGSSAGKIVREALR